jgi:hypothetical protein
MTQGWLGRRARPLPRRTPRSRQRPAPQPARGVCSPSRIRHRPAASFVVSWVFGTDLPSRTVHRGLDTHRSLGEERSETTGVAQPNFDAARRYVSPSHLASGRLIPLLPLPQRDGARDPVFICDLELTNQRLEMLRLARGFTESFGSRVASILHAETHDDAVGPHPSYTDGPNGSGSLWISLVSIVHPNKRNPGFAGPVRRRTHSQQHLVPCARARYSGEAPRRHARTRPHPNPTFPLPFAEA